MKLAFATLCAAVAMAARVAMETDVMVASSYTNWESTPVEVKDAAKTTVFMMMKHDPVSLRKLEQALMAVSDPRSDRYGKHLTIEELGRLTPIADSAVSRVTDFLKSEGVTDIDVNANKDMIEATMSVAQANALFEADVRLFNHKHKKEVGIYRSASPYTLPEEVAEVVSFVGDLLRVPRLRTVAHVDVPEVAGPGLWTNECTGLAGCKGLVTPYVCRKRYGIDSSGLDDVFVAGNSISVAEFQGQVWSQKDVTKFSEGCLVNVTVDKQIGPNTGTTGIEAMLDIEYAGGVSPEVPLYVRYAATYSLLQWSKDISSDPDAALIHSVSYGNDEAQQTGDDYIFTTAAQFQKAGARGLSILFASGDQGVCGREGCGVTKHGFHPDFPAAMPWVTAVGGTDFVTYDIGEEQVWSAGGGGFSDHFGIPDWQADVVAAYKANPDANLPDQSLWNNTGRGYPDVAALGGQKTSYCVVANGVTEGVAGTSASSPVVAAIFAKLNGLRLAAGKSPLGFLNPFIYQNADKFNDVVKGMNNANYKIGFSAVKGWDAASGVGTPDFSKLKAAVLALP